MTPKQARDLIRMAVSGQTEHAVELVTTTTHTEEPHMTATHEDQQSGVEPEVFVRFLKEGFAQQVADLADRLAMQRTVNAALEQIVVGMRHHIESLEGELARATSTSTEAAE